MDNREEGAVRVREARREDVPAILDIYNDAVIHTTASYDLEPVSLESRYAWFDSRLASGFPVLVAEGSGGEVLGFASYGPFREKAAYAGTVEHSVYIAPGQRGGGLGLRLMQELIARARAQGVHVMVGGVDGDNLGSLRFHERLGFSEVARMPQVGRKFDRWLDLVFMQRILQEE